MRKIGVLTSGGDAPGMNAAVRAVVRAGIDKGWTVCGIKRGFAGLIDGDFVPLGARNVGGIIQHGGTVLGTSRCDEFRAEDGRARAHKNLIDNDVEALVVIGGNGSQTGACMLSQTGFPVVGIASTIDNDLKRWNGAICCTFWRLREAIAAAPLKLLESAEELSIGWPRDLVSNFDGVRIVRRTSSTSSQPLNGTIKDTLRQKVTCRLISEC